MLGIHLAGECSGFLDALRVQPSGNPGGLPRPANETGSLEVADGGDPLSILRGSPAGLSAGDLARALFGTPTPTKAEEHRARRKLERWCREGFAHRREEQAARGAIKSPDRYFAVSERDGMETLE
jgi:hypothetical protein